MSNNKQNMKLYTEFEVKFAMDVARCQPNRTFDEVLEELTPIELPSDEEIDNESESFFYNYKQFMPTIYEIMALRIGAKWMRDKIQGGNK